MQNMNDINPLFFVGILFFTDIYTTFCNNQTWHFSFGQMKDIVEIYIRMIMAVFGFVAPSFTLLLSIFFEGIEASRKKHKEQIQRMDKLIKESIQDKSGTGLAKAVKESNYQYEKQRKETQAELNLLNPRRQIRRIFIPLMGALICVGGYHLERMPQIKTPEWVKAFSLAASLLLFLYVLIVLWQLFSVIIQIKESAGSEKRKPKVQISQSNSNNDNRWTNSRS